ncbi:MAG: DUF222 domain-containing protein [Actinomycetota bacterium]
MSELRSAIEGMRLETLAELPDARLEEDFAELQRASELIDAERLRRLAEIERRGSYQRDGHLSAASWLASTFKMAWGTARNEVRMARALDDMPVTRRALEEGELSMSAARVLVDARDADHEAFRSSEASLVEAARIHSMQDVRRVAAYWRQAAEREAAMGGEEKLRERRRLHASVTFMGMVRVDGDLDPETGETLLTALRAVLDAESRSGGPDDGRTPAQRRADALGEVCRQWLDLGERPTVAGERPHVTVTVDEEALTGGGGRVSELDHAGPVDPALARRVACDGSIRRVVMAGRSEPLDVGRRTPVVSPALRRAVIVRDRGCRFPGCDRPHSWCDAHHVVHWADGGPTALANLVLLCRRHHRMVHGRGGFRLELEDGRPAFRRPDGSVLLEDRAPP